jgi:hypothetical protein
MKKIILILLIISSNLFATNWYVDKYATGSANGTSWANAWTTPWSISWASIQPGDFIFLSGGTDSVVYQATDITFGKSGTPGHLITLSKGRDAGHNGKVILQGNSNVSGEAIVTTGRNYIRIVGFTIRTWITAIHTNNSNVVYMDSINTTDCYWTIGVSNYGTESDSIFIWNSHLVGTITTDGQTDIISGNGCSYLDVRNCYIFQANRFSKSAHSDCIQCYACGTQLYANNWLESVASGRDSAASANDNGQVQMDGDSCIWYNNVMITRGWSYNSYHDSGGLLGKWVLINNTCIKEYDWSPAGIWHTIVPKTFGYNNIVYSTNRLNMLFYQSATLSPGEENFDYNFWYHPNISNIVNTLTLAQWQAIGGDIHGGEGDPMFVDFHHQDTITFAIPERNDLRLEVGSPCIGAGTASVKAYVEAWGLEWESFNNTWIPWATGGARSNTTPSIGVYEYGAVAITDTVPSFSFTALTGRELNTEYIATSPITGLDSICHFWTTTAASFKINYNGNYNTSMKTANPDNGADTVYVKNMTGGSYSQMYTETIVGGGSSKNFNVTTKSETPAPSGESGVTYGSNGKLLYTNDGKILKVKK